MRVKKSSENRGTRFKHSCDINMTFTHGIESRNIRIVYNPDLPVKCALCRVSIEKGAPRCKYSVENFDRPDQHERCKTHSFCPKCFVLLRFIQYEGAQDACYATFVDIFGGCKQLEQGGDPTQESQPKRQKKSPGEEEENGNRDGDGVDPLSG